MTSKDYRHDLLKQRVEGDRRFNVSRACRELGMTRTHFYDILNGAEYVHENTIRRVAEYLGIDPGVILKRSIGQKNLTPTSRNT